MAFMFDREQLLAKNYLFQSQFSRVEEVPSRYLQYSYQVDSGHTSQNMYEDLLLSLAHQTGRGAFPLHYIVEKNLPVDISVLCDYVDFLCSSFILCFCTRKGSFHNVTLPRTWLLKYFEIDAPYFNPTIRTNIFWHIPDCMTVLLEQLYTGAGADYLIYGVNRNMYNSPAIVRNLFIFRLVRAMCLLGCNTLNDALREKIRKAVARLGNFGRPHRLYSKFVYAANENWMALAKATRRSLEDDSADDMIQLLERTRMSASQAEGGICKIFYDRADDIRSLLRDRPVTSAETRPISQTEQAVPSAQQISQPVVQEEHLEETADEPDENDDQPTEALDMPEMTPPSPEEHAAALLIQNLYRSVMARRRGFAKDGIAGLKNHLYNTCMSVGLTGSYRYIFLGPLVSILTCVDYAKSECLALKNRTKKKLTNAESQEMEELDDLLSKTNRSGRALFDLEKSLQPTADVHVRRDVLELRKVVGRANEVLSDLPFQLTPELSEELAIGVRGILTMRAYRHKRKPKPDVRLDEGGFEYYD
ncbi:hypothetical protein CPB85DRAFT_1254762 [Mucidula mucida]|nr:hypothetical protein CPB85DRAFT_1254762 [Mucidula mucida]